MRVARRIVAESGAAGLTMRRLSDELGVTRALMRLIAQDIYRDIAPAA